MIKGFSLLLPLQRRGASTYRPRAWTVYREDEEWGVLSSSFEIPTGARQIVVLKIDTIQTSCGYAVPRYEFVEQRETLRKSSEKMGEVELANYRQKNNLKSIDGQPTGLRG